MTDNKLPKLLVNKAEASEIILKRINIGKELYNSQISSEEELTNLKNETNKWTDHNNTLFKTLFDNSPLLFHGSIMGAVIYQENSVLRETEAHKRNLNGWINELESICEQLDLYEELPNNTQQALDHNTANNKNMTIFIGHGGSHLWREFKDFLVETLGLEYEEFDRVSAAGKSINNRLEEMLDKSRMAFLIMTGEDEDSDGSLNARQNVVHEIGKCEEKFGSERTIILLEEGCKKFSNIDGIIYIPFAKDKIKETFGDVVKVLIRESIIRIEFCN